jgi:hypothetical protein
VGTTKIQCAGRDFLIRLVAKHGLVGAARVLRALADELEGPWFAREGLGAGVVRLLLGSTVEPELSSGGPDASGDSYGGNKGGQNGCNSA